MKNFVEPFVEIIKLDGAVIATSACGCFDGVDDWGKVCTRDTPACCQCTSDTGPGGNCVCTQN